MSQAPQTNDLAKALEQVSNPEPYCAFPSLYGSAWKALKAARGQTVNFGTVGDVAHRIEPSDPVVTRIRNYARARTNTLRNASTTPGAH